MTGTLTQEDKPVAGTVKMTATQAIVKFLEAQGVEAVYGVPGAGILPFYDALLESDSIKSYVVRHEQMGVFMADGYSRATGKVGVCAATSGPGATNLVTGLYGAVVDSVPLLAFTGQVPTSFLGTDAFQEAPTTAIVEPVTKKAFLVKKAEDIPRVIKEAYRLATNGRKGPVLIDLPLDVQKATIEVDMADFVPQEPEPLPIPGDEEINKAIEVYRVARKPVLLVGGGIVLAEAWKELKELAEFLGVPVLHTLMGKDCFPADHPLNGGMVGTICNCPTGNHTFLNADLVVALGNRFGDRATGTLEVYTKNRKFIHVNLDPKEINRAVRVDVGISADVKAFMVKFLAAAKQSGLGKDYRIDERIQNLSRDRERLARRTDFGQVPIKPQEAIAKLREFLNRDAVVTLDCGISQIWGTQFFDAYEPRTFLITGRAGIMGWGLGAAMAAKLARPDVQCVNLVGDGSLGMSLQDLATAVKFNIPVVVFVLNNSLLGLIRQQQNWFYKERWISTELDYLNKEAGHERGIDFVTVASGMGAVAELVNTVEEIKPALERAFASGRPTVLEVVVDPFAVCSMSGDSTLTGVRETV